MVLHLLDHFVRPCDDRLSAEAADPCKELGTHHHIRANGEMIRPIRNDEDISSQSVTNRTD